MSDPSQLSKRERQIMDVIYAHGEATIGRVLTEMPDPPMRGASSAPGIHGAEGPLGPPPGGAPDYLPAHPAPRAGRAVGTGARLDVFFNGSLEKAVAAHLSDPERKKSRTWTNCSGSPG